MYRTTYNVISSGGNWLKAQVTLDRLKVNDPIWCSKNVWITSEPAHEPKNHNGLNVWIETKTLPPVNPITKPHWSNK